MNTLLQDIEQFLADTGMSPSRFGLLATHNSRLVERLREGKDILRGTEVKARAFIDERRGQKGSPDKAA